MKPEIHPDAAKNFDEKARVLLAAVAPEPRPEPVEPPTHMFRPGGHVVATFGEEDYVEFKTTGKSDQLGRKTARYFDHERARRQGGPGRHNEGACRAQSCVRGRP